MIRQPKYLKSLVSLSKERIPNPCVARSSQAGGAIYFNKLSWYQEEEKGSWSTFWFNTLQNMTIQPPGIFGHGAVKIILRGGHVVDVHTMKSMA